MMPKALQYGLWLVVFEAILVGAVAVFMMLGLIGSTAARHGEPPFTRDQRADLEMYHPGGKYVADSEYVYCGADGWFHHVDSASRDWIISERDTCAPWLTHR